MTEAGSVSVIAVATLVVVAVAGLAIGALAQTQHGAWRAQTSADAAALAAASATFPPVGAGAPRDEAVAIAAANGGQLLDCVCSVDASFAVRSVDVTVAVNVTILGYGRATVVRSARAEFDPVAALGW